MILLYANQLFGCGSQKARVWYEISVFCKYFCINVKPYFPLMVNLSFNNVLMNIWIYLYFRDRGKQDSGCQHCNWCLCCSLQGDKGRSRMNRACSPSLVRPTLLLRRPASSSGLVTPSSLTPAIIIQSTWPPQECSLLTSSSHGILRIINVFLLCSFWSPA